MRAIRSGSGLAMAAVLTSCAKPVPIPELPNPRFIAFDRQGQRIAQEEFDFRPFPPGDPNGAFALVLNLKASALSARPVVDGAEVAEYAVVRQDAIYKTDIPGFALRMVLRKERRASWPSQLHLHIGQERVDIARVDPESHYYVAGSVHPEATKRTVQALGEWQWLSVSPDKSALNEPAFAFPPNLVCAEHFLRKGEWAGSAIAFSVGKEDLEVKQVLQRLKEEGYAVSLHMRTASIAKLR